MTQTQVVIDRFAVGDDGFPYHERATWLQPTADPRAVEIPDHEGLWFLLAVAEPLAILPKTSFDLYATPITAGLRLVTELEYRNAYEAWRLANDDGTMPPLPPLTPPDDNA